MKHAHFDNTKHTFPGINKFCFNLTSSGPVIVVFSWNYQEALSSSQGRLDSKVFVITALFFSSRLGLFFDVLMLKSSCVAVKFLDCIDFCFMLKV